MLRTILTVWTTSINVLTRQNWENFCNNWSLTHGISSRRLQSCGKEGLRPFPSSSLLSRSKNTLYHNDISRTTEDRQFWRTSLHSALHMWSALLAVVRVPAYFLDSSVQVLTRVAYSSYVYPNPDHTHRRLTRRVALANCVMEKACTVAAV